MSREEVRPRYCPERPLPALAYVPGLVPHQQKPTEDHSYYQWNGEPDTLSKTAGFRWGVDLFNHQFYWEAHEAWEALWVLAQPETASRYLLQGLIQMAAAMLKATTQDWDVYERIAGRAISKLEKSRGLDDETQFGFAPVALAEQLRDISSTHTVRSAGPCLRIEQVVPSRES